MFAKGAAVFVDWMGGVRTGRVESHREGGVYFLTLDDGSPVGAPEHQVFALESEAWGAVAAWRQRQVAQAEAAYEKAVYQREAAWRRERGITG